jgi:hypothetical protein
MHTMVAALLQYLETLGAYMEILYDYKPWSPDHELLCPALIFQQFWLHFNV